MRTLAVGFVSVFLSGAAAAQNTFTGCLTRGGSIVNVAIGSDPAQPCRGSQIQVSWNEQGPQGPQGIHQDQRGHRGQPDRRGQLELRARRDRPDRGVIQGRRPPNLSLLESPGIRLTAIAV
jgi:hypothetical protein